MPNRIAAIQITSGHSILDNLKVAADLINRAASQGAKLVVLPEMFAVMGLDQMDKVRVREELGNGPIQNFLSEQAKTYGIWLVGGTIPITVKENTEKVYAACLIYNDQGKVVGHYNKIHLFDVSFSAAREQYAESKTTDAGHDITVVETPFGKLGVAVCYDIRFPEMFRLMHARGVELIVLPAAFTYLTGAAHWEILIRARAIENQVYMIAAAQTGVHANGRKTYGHSMVVDPWGSIKADLAEGEGVVVADIELDTLHKLRGEFPVLTHRRF